MSYIIIIIIVSEVSLIMLQWPGFSLYMLCIIEFVDSISMNERDFSYTHYITIAGISHGRYTIMHFKHHHRVLQMISNRMSI